MRRIRLVVRYDGTDYGGWQRQANAPSVQAELEAAIERLTGAFSTVRGAGRTDAGVHALGQVAAFSTASTVATDVFRKGLNAHLPPAIAVARADEVAPSFDPRRDAHGKLYRYRIWNSSSRNPFEARFSWQLARPLDVAATQQAATALVGTHDFAAFRAADCERKTTVRDVRRLDVSRDGDLVTVEIEATAFLKNMVRIVVGTLVAAGHGKLALSDMIAIRDGRDRTRAGMTAPPEGLFLVRVDYDGRGPPERRG